MNQVVNEQCETSLLFASTCAILMACLRFLWYAMVGQCGFVSQVHSVFVFPFQLTEDFYFQVLFLQVAPLSLELLLFACMKSLLTITTDLGCTTVIGLRLQEYAIECLGWDGPDKDVSDPGTQVKALLEQKCLAEQNAVSESLCLLLAFLFLILDDLPFGAPCTITCTLMERRAVLTSHAILLMFKAGTTFIVDYGNRKQIAHATTSLTEYKGQGDGNIPPMIPPSYSHIGTHWRMLLYFAVVVISWGTLYTSLLKFRLRLAVPQCNATNIPSSHLF